MNNEHSATYSIINTLCYIWINIVIKYLIVCTRQKTNIHLSLHSSNDPQILCLPDSEHWETNSFDYLLKESLYIKLKLIVY